MEISGSKRTLGVIVDALQRDDVKVIDRYVKPTVYGEDITIVVVPSNGIYGPKKLEEFRRNLVPQLEIEGTPFAEIRSGILLGNLDYTEEVPTVEIGSPTLRDKSGTRKIQIRIYANEQMAEDFRHETPISIDSWTLFSYRFKSYSRKALNLLRI